MEDDKIEIPIVYQLFLKRLHKESFKGRIDLKRAKRILTYYYRVPKNMAREVLNEFEQAKWIEFENYMTILILEQPDCEILYKHRSREPTTP